MATWTRLVSNTKVGGGSTYPVPLNIDYTVQNIKRTGNTVTFDYGIRFSMSTGSYTYNSICAFCPAGKTKYVAFGANGNVHTVAGVYYYANKEYDPDVKDKTTLTTTKETVAFSYSQTVASDATSLKFSIGYGWNKHNPDQLGTADITVKFPIGFTNPSWTKYTINSLPATAYANMPYSYELTLQCDYGSSTANNKLSWISTDNISMASTTGTSLTGARTYTFKNANIGSHTFRGVISYTNASNKAATMVNDTTRKITVSFLNPTLTSITHTINNKTSGINLYRTTTVTSKSSATVNKNSSTPTAYVYFSDKTDAPGDSGGDGYYALSKNTYSNISKSYSHPGTRKGTFYAQLAIVGDDKDGDEVTFATYNKISYTMQAFVVPTATRTITYNKNNIYVGQTKFPVTVKVTAVNKSTYDTLTPTFNLGTCTGGNWAYDTDGLKHHSFATGTYNYTLIKSQTPYVAGNQASFKDELVYMDALNKSASTSVSSSTYTVKTIPKPTANEITLSISQNKSTKIISASITGDIDTDFRCNYTLYIEGAESGIIYATYNDFFTDTVNRKYNFKYDTSINEEYRARLVCNYVLVDETNVAGGSSTFTTRTVRVFDGDIAYVKYGTTIKEIYLSDAEDCPIPRIAFSYGETIGYAPLVTTSKTGSLRVKSGSTVYRIIEDYIPPLKQYQLAAYTHQELHAFTNYDIQHGHKKLRKRS